MEGEIVHKDFCHHQNGNSSLCPKYSLLGCSISMMGKAHSGGIRKFVVRCSGCGHWSQHEYLLTHLLLLWELAVSITALPGNQNSSCIRRQTNQSGHLEEELYLVGLQDGKRAFWSTKDYSCWNQHENSGNLKPPILDG